MPSARSRVLLALALLLPAGGLGAQDVATSQKTYRQAARETAKAFRKDLAGVAATLRADLGTLLDGLQAGRTEPSELPGALLDVYEQAFLATATHLAGRAGEVEEVGSFLNAGLAAADPDLGAAPGFVVGDGGTTDRFHADLRAALARHHATFARELGRVLKKARQTLPDDAVLTAVVLPPAATSLGEPGLDPAPLQTAFVVRAPLFLSGYGRGDERTFAVLGSATSALVNVYDGDGQLLDGFEALQGGSASLFRLVAPVPDGAQEPHGNLRVEMFANGSGWTSSIGY